MVGFTSGALCIASDQQEHHVQAEPELGGQEISLEEGYIESEQDNEHEESSDGGKSADSDSDDDGRNKAKIYSTEIDLKSVDWDRFYLTGELTNNTEPTVNVNIQDVQNGHQAETQSQAYKKRLVLMLCSGE